jgi:hypothetical protein
VHRFPQTAAPPHVQPEIRAVAEHAGKDERGLGGHGPALVAQLVHVLTLHNDIDRRSTLTAPAAGQTTPSLAILIDGENVSSTCWPAALAIAGRFGMPTVVRAYVCHPPSPGWVAAKGVEIVDGRPADGPNAADFLLAMDAAVMAAERRVDGFVLLTGDDGFAAVAQDLKRRGAAVYALIPLNGEAIPRRLAAAAELSVLVPLPTAAMSVPHKEAASFMSMEDRWANDLRIALARCPVDNDGWAALSELGAALKSAGAKMPKGKLSDLVRRVDGVEVRGASAKAWLRLRCRVSPSAPLAAPPSTSDVAALDDEIPF